MSGSNAVRTYVQTYTTYTIHNESSETAARAAHFPIRSAIGVRGTSPIRNPFQTVAKEIREQAVESAVDKTGAVPANEDIRTTHDIRRVAGDGLRFE